MAVDTVRATCLSHDVDAMKIAHAGEWKPVNPKDPHVIEIGKFAVEEFNNISGTDLVFVKVDKGWSRVIKTGTLYKLIVIAKGVIATTYQTLVHEDGSNGKTLVYFKPE